MTEYQLKELSDRFMNDEMFVRSIYCHPGIEATIKSCVKSNDICVYTSRWIEIGKYYISKDIIVEISLSSSCGYDDFLNNKITITASPEFY